jgi:hypothetical protein
MKFLLKDLERRTKLTAQLYFAKAFASYMKKKLPHLIIDKDSK